MSGRVVFFGLDGATFTVLDDLVRRDVMPCLGDLARSGVRGTLRSTIPPLTPPAWTTLVTGRTPGHHGITNFLQFESETSHYVRFVTSREVCSETLWSMANRMGKRAGFLNFVAHNPAPKVDGFGVPGWVPWRWVKKQSHPPELIAQLKNDLPDFDVKELAMNFSEEEKAIAGTVEEEYEPWIELHIRRERQWFNIMKHQMTHNPCDLVAVVFDGVDKLQHLLWEFLDPAREPENPSEDYLRVRQLCWDYFRQIDRFLEQTLELAGPDAYVFVGSDHGFTGSTEILYINNWLEQEGYLAWAPKAEVQSQDSQDLGLARPYHVSAFDFTKTKAYAYSASSNGICIPVKGVRGDYGIEPEHYESFRAELIDALRTRCVDPATGEPLIREVWTREQVFLGPRMSQTPDLTVALRDFGNFSVLRSNVVLKPRPRVMGCHHPEGIFYACGPGVRAGENLKPLRLVDVAPTILYALGLPVPADLEGRVVTDVFTPQHLAAHRVERGPETVRPAHLAADEEAGDEYDEESQAQVLMRLKALGYIE